MKNEVFYANHICVTGHLGVNLKNFSLSLFTGEVLGLFGNRHAGKGALFQVMTGKIPLSAGSIEWEGSPDKPSPSVARITKNFAIIDELEIWENIALLWKKAVTGSFFNSARQKNMIRLYLEDYGLFFDLNKKAGTLSQLQKVYIEVLMALRHNVRVLAIDLNSIEGTAQEYHTLKSLLQRIRQEDVAVMVSSHQAEIISLLSDRIVVIYNGRILKEFASSALTPLELKKLSSRLYRVEKQTAPKTASSHDCILQVKGLDAGLGKAVSFSLYRGEYSAIVSPQGEMFQILYRRILEGEQERNCTVVFQNIRLGKVENGQGIFFLDTRYLDALIDEMTPLENLCLGISDKAGILGFENKHTMQSMERDFYDWYGHEEILQRKNCRSLYKKYRVAINLFRLRFLKADVIFCNALSVHSDVVSYQMAEDALIELTRTGTSVCMLSNDIGYRDDAIERHVVFEADKA